MIRVFFEKQGNCPVIVCEICGDRIKAGTGMYSFLPRGDSAEVHFVCKGGCDCVLQRQIGRTLWGEIPVLLGFLISNTGTTHRKAREAADLSASMRF